MVPKVALIILILILIGLLVLSSAPKPLWNVSTNMRITSPAFPDHGNIPAKYTCSGQNINPELDIAEVPPEAISLALILDDPDAPGGTFTHWLLWNIDPRTAKIEEDTEPAGAISGENSASKFGYTGPCPPPEYPHHYHFKLYALNVKLNLSQGASESELTRAIASHQLAWTELVGLFQR